MAAGSVGAAEKMPEFSEKNITGDGLVNRADFAGKVLLVNFWATWCPPCRKEIPALIKIHDKYKDQGFSVIGISMDEGGRRVVGKFVEKLGVNYPVFIGNAKLGRGFGGVMGIPVTFLVDREGNLVQRLDGYISEKVLDKQLYLLLKQKE
ncbi:MAG: TlpA disulfide reductase family protein [Desulfurivibrionaceae bacterium]|nr:TlpA disulfide reductase family protein [Desulfurivibrionaceae bacterium]